MTVPEVLLSIVIPAYNYADHLPRAVHSVLGQLKDHHELLVVNDGSTDHTRQVLDSLLRENPGQFRVIHKENGGAASARNRGIAEARGEFLDFLDADDELAPGALALIDEHLARDPSTRMLCGAHWAVEQDGRKRLHRPGEFDADPVRRVEAYLLKKRVTLANGACLFHREVFQRGLYPEHLRSAEDLPVFAQALGNFSCSLTNAPLAVVHKHSDSLRHRITSSADRGDALVSEIFDAGRLGTEFGGLRSAYAVQRQLSLFRSAFLAGDEAVAKQHFRTALKQDWTVIFKASYTRKAIRLFTRFKR